MLQRTEIKSFFFGLTGMLFLISGAVLLTLSCKGLYKSDMKRYDLAGESGYSEEEILENYDELISYNLSPFHKMLKFPTFPMSEEARIHFKEVKSIFQSFLWMTGISSILLVWIFFRSYKKQDWKFLKYTGICSIAIPLLLGILIERNWEKVFVSFHELIFQNDYWLFDPVTDPIILVLPDEYFMHCAMMIIAIVFIGAVLSLVSWNILKKSSLKNNRA